MSSEKGPETSPSEVNHPLFARLFHLLTPALERELAPHRRRLLADLHGEVLEVGCGSGANFPHYPPTVSRVVALEPEPYLRRQALRQAERCAVAVEVLPNRAEELPQGVGPFDFIVTTLVFCSIADPAAALEGLAGLLKPSGRLCFLEHVRGRGSKALAQELLDRSRLWPAVAGGCHCSRDLLALLGRSPFVVEEVEELNIGPRLLHVNPHLRGSARLGER